MNFYSVVSRAVVCVAAIGFVISAAACQAKEVSGSPQPGEPVSSGDASQQTDQWSLLATDTPSPMTEVQGETFGLNDWKVGKTQGYFGVNKLLGCVVGLSALNNGEINVMVEKNDTGELVDTRNASTHEDIRHGIWDFIEKCQ